MELLDGIDLYSVVSQFGPLEPERVVHLLTQACGSLAEAHTAGLIHRDIKPGNMMLCRRGGAYDVLKILDFGLVKDSDADRSQPDISSETQIVGTPLYMAPEAIAYPGQVDKRTDLYALGASAYFMLTGRHIFEADERDKVFKQQMEDVPKRPSSLAPGPIPEQLETIVMQCLKKKQDDRPDSADALGEMLEALDISPRWTQAQARAWWEEHKPSAHLHDSSSAEVTLVDPPRLLAPDPHASTEPALGSTLRSPSTKRAAS